MRDLKEKEIDYCFRIYGDNILETEMIIKLALNYTDDFKLKEIIGPIDRSLFILEEINNNKSNMGLHLCPGYDHWKNSPIKNIFSEKPDIVITHIDEDGNESEPIIAIESCDSIQAGNQGWQRFRRMADAAQNGIPFLYILPLIDWERDSKGFDLKSPRYQNPMITLGQLTLSSKYHIPSLQIYKKTSWVDFAKEENYPLPEDLSNFEGLKVAADYLFRLLKHKIDKDTSSLYHLKEPLKSILEDMIKVAKRYTNYKNTKLPIHLNHDALKNDTSDISEEYSEALISNEPIIENYRLDNISEENFYENGEIFQKRVQRRTLKDDAFFENIIYYLNWKDTELKQNKIDFLEKWGVDIEEDKTSAQLNSLVRDNFEKVPVSYKKPPAEATLIANREVFRGLLSNTYPDINEEILEWVYSSKSRSGKPLFFVPMYGYKPSGDSRPDRGLLPLLNSLFPKLLTPRNTLIVMYSKYTPDSWQEILDNGNNLLWTSIKEYAGAIVVDKTGSGKILVGEQNES